MRIVVTCITAVTLIAAACSSDEAPSAGGQASDTATATATRPGPYVRGVAIRGESPRFVPCGTADTLRLVDVSGTMPARGGDGDVAAIFAVVAGRIEGDTAVTIERVVYASADSGECYNDWSGFDYRATGNDPGWVAEVSGTDIRLRRQGDVNFSWSGVAKDSSAGRLQFTAAAAGQNGALELVLEAEPCTDRIARRLSTWSARVAVGGEVLRGCAVPGM